MNDSTQETQMVYDYDAGKELPIVLPKPTTDQAPTTEQRPAKNKGGAPIGSRNAMRHGLRCGSLPKGCRRIESETIEFRRTLEDAVMAARGVVSVVDAATIARAQRWEVHNRLAARWLAKQADTMTT